TTARASTGRGHSRVGRCEGVSGMLAPLCCCRQWNGPHRAIVILKRHCADVDTDCGARRVGLSSLYAPVITLGPEIAVRKIHPWPCSGIAHTSGKNKRGE